MPEAEFTSGRLQQIHKILVKSRFHRSLYPQIPDQKFAVVPNGIDTTLFAENGNRDPFLMINTSSPVRSLETFLDCFAAIKQQVPLARAQWAYGWDVWDIVHGSDPRMMEWKAKMQARMKELGVEERGRISHSEVAALYRRANIFAYPSEMAEIDCISLSKAMAQAQSRSRPILRRSARNRATAGYSSTPRRRRIPGRCRASSNST